mmetsp:Transcript_34888/g.80816  ORF Transcript_34888/g.80816 Transcript_34888/m.80816 type:complete len:316 (-) Transcript_34888:219-1166(-)
MSTQSKHGTPRTRLEKPGTRTRTRLKRGTVATITRRRSIGAKAFAGNRLVAQPMSSCLRRAGRMATRLVAYNVPDTNAVFEFLSRHGLRVGALHCTRGYVFGRPLVNLDDTQAVFRLPLWPAAPYDCHQNPPDLGAAEDHASRSSCSSAKRPRLIQSGSSTLGIQSLTLERVGENGDVDGVPLATILSDVTPNLRHLCVQIQISSWSSQTLRGVALSPASKSVTLLDWGRQGPVFDTWAATEPFTHGRGLEALVIHGDASSGSSQLMAKAPSELAGTLHYLQCSQEQLSICPAYGWRMTIDEVEAAMAPVKFRLT